MSSPSMRMLPALGRSSPASSPSSVDLPEPEAPTMATASPGLISRLIPSKMPSPPSAVTTSFPTLLATISGFMISDDCFRSCCLCALALFATLPARGNAALRAGARRLDQRRPRRARRCRLGRPAAPRARRLRGGERQHQRRNHRGRQGAAARAAATAPPAARGARARRQRRPARLSARADARQPRGDDRMPRGRRRPRAAARHAHSAELRAALHRGLPRAVRRTRRAKPAPLWCPSCSRASRPMPR